MLYDQMKRWMRKPSMFGLLEELKASYGCSAGWLDIRRIQQKESTYLALRDGLLLLVSLLVFELSFRAFMYANEQDTKKLSVVFLATIAGIFTVAVYALAVDGVIRLCCYILDIHSPYYMSVSFEYLEMRTANNIAMLAMRESMSDTKHTCPILFKWAAKQSCLTRAMEEIRLQPFNTIVQVHSVGLMASLNRKVTYPNDTVAQCAFDLIAYDRGYDPTELPGSVFAAPIAMRRTCFDHINTIVARWVACGRFKTASTNTR